MTSLLGESPIAPEVQQKNDRHRIGMVLAVLAFLALFIYLFTYAAKDLNAPMPRDLADRLGIPDGVMFDQDRNLESDLYIPFTFRHNNDDERLIFFLGVAAAFLLVYFLPLKYKERSLVVSFMVIVGILYGLKGLAGLMGAHLCVYLLLHPVSSYRLWLSALPGSIGFCLFSSYAGFNITSLFLATLAGAASLALYKYLILTLLTQDRPAEVLRTLGVQSALITVLIGAVTEGLQGEEWTLPLGLLLFFWHWERLFMYHIDYKDGHIPNDISLWKYLSIFLSPGTIANWNWGVTIGQGYAYTTNSFLCKDKNEIVAGGLKLWGTALIYLVFGDWIHQNLILFLKGNGIQVFWRVREMACYHVQGHAVSPSAVLVTTMVELLRWFFIWGGVLHFKVGLWRVCGYQVAPYFNRPWQSTNLVSLWSRFTFHYREFLVRAFYYPCFFRFFKQQTHLRIFAATLAAAGFGNLIWGHISESLFFRGLEYSNITRVLDTWPYFLFLALGITVSQFWLLYKKKERKPWTADGKITNDILATYVTLQFYALIHIFYYRCPDGTVWDHFRLFFIGFGIH